MVMYCVVFQLECGELHWDVLKARSTASAIWNVKKYCLDWYGCFNLVEVYREVE